MARTSMDRSRGWSAAASWLLAVPIFALGCAAGGESSDSTSTRINRANVGQGTPMGSAGAGAMQTVDSSGFGNSTKPVPTPSGGAQAPMPGMLPDGCEVGKRCAPTKPDGDCGSLTLEAEVETIMHPGNVLLVFDTSGSMADRWNGMSRWEQAGNAIKNALMPLSGQLTVGAVFFPRSDPNAPATCIDPTGIACLFVPQLVIPGGTCGVTPITSPDQINFAPATEFLATFSMGAAPRYAPVPGGFTPLKEGLQQAQAALAAGTLMGVTSVVVITDGDPNCQWDQATALQIVTDWQAKGINTYVIGLPGTTGAGEAVLTQLAMAGGTTQYITPNDSKALEDKLREIATETVRSGFDSCEIKISPPAEAPEKLHLIVTENGAPADVKRDLADDYKWNINGDGSMVTLEGRLCDDATGGRFEALRFEFGCVDVPPLTPPPPVE